MGAATTQARAGAVQALAQQTIDLDTARDLFTAARTVGESAQLAGALADDAAPVAAREAVVRTVFGPTLGASAVAVLTAVTAERWSNADDLVHGIEELAIRATAIASPKADIEGELFSFTRIVAANPSLELALGSTLGDDSAKGTLIDTLLGSVADPATTLVVASLVQQPRERRVRQLLTRAMEIIAAQRGRTVATVISATPLASAQVDRLAKALSEKYHGDITLNPVVDPSIVGGLRVQIADDVIDGSISARLADVRQRLVG